MPTEQDLRKFTSTVEEAVSYPILTQDTSGYNGNGSSNGSSGGSSGSSSLTNTAQQTIRQVLGWRYRGEDTKGFLAALNKAFDLREVEGHTEWEWKPQSYMLQADLGEITGAQASVHKQAQVAVEQALPLLDALTPLRTDADEEDVEAMRSIVRTELNELVNELAVVGGPRVLRVDTFFEKLLGPLPPKSFDPEKVDGQLKRIRERFGLTRARVNTLSEEQNLTNFLILVDYVNSLYQAWDTKRGYFSGTQEPFLGTQLVILSQVLDAILEQLHETYDAMDSVFFGPAERQTTPLQLTEGTMTVSELLGWVETFATVEGRQLIQDAGKDGVVIFRSTIERLASLTTEAAAISAQPSNNPARPFHTRRVANALGELANYLGNAVDQAEKISRRPVRFAEINDGEENLPLTSNPFPSAPLPNPSLFKFDWQERRSGDSWKSRKEHDVIHKGDEVRGTLYGLNLRSGLAFDFGTDVEILQAKYQTAERVLLRFRVNQTAVAGPRTLSARDAHCHVGVLEDAIVIASTTEHSQSPKVELLKIDPACGAPGETKHVTLSGRNLGSGIGLSFGAGIQVKSIQYGDKNSLKAEIEISPYAEPGSRRVLVFGSDCRHGHALEFHVESSGREAIEVALVPTKSRQQFDGTHIPDYVQRATETAGFTPGAYRVHEWPEPLHRSKEQKCKVQVKLEPGQSVKSAHLICKADSTKIIQHTNIQKQADNVTTLVFDTSSAPSGEYELIKVMNDNSIEHVPIAVQII